VINLSDFTFDEENHVGRLDGQLVKSTTTILKEEGFVDTTWFTEYGRQKGSHAHKAILLDYENDLDESTVDEAIKGRLEAARKFRKETGLEILEMETRYFHPVWMYTGKPDLICKLFGKLAVVDYKPWTIQWWVKYQLAAYALMLSESPFARFALRLGDDGRYRLEQYKDRADLNHWIAIATVNRLKTLHKKENGI